MLRLRFVLGLTANIYSKFEHSCFGHETTALLWLVGWFCSFVGYGTRLSHSGGMVGALAMRYLINNVAETRSILRLRELAGAVLAAVANWEPGTGNCLATSCCCDPQ